MSKIEELSEIAKRHGYEIVWSRGDEIDAITKDGEPVEDISELPDELIELVLEA